MNSFPQSLVATASLRSASQIRHEAGDAVLCTEAVAGCRAAPAPHLAAALAVVPVEWSNCSNVHCDMVAAQIATSQPMFDDGAHKCEIAGISTSLLALQTPSLDAKQDPSHRV